jgi:hypothetical protein
MNTETNDETIRVEKLCRAHPALTDFIRPLLAEQQDGTVFCLWGASPTSHRPLCMELARWAASEEPYCDRHALAIVRFALVAKSRAPLGIGTPQPWRTALRQDEVALLPTETREQLDVLAELLPLTPPLGVVTEHDLGAWLWAAQQVGLLSRLERTTLVDAIAKAIYAACDRHPQAPAAP